MNREGVFVGWPIWEKDPDGFHLKGVFALSIHNSPATGSEPAKNPTECVSSRGRRRGQVLCRKERKSRKKGNLARTEISQERKSRKNGNLTRKEISQVATEREEVDSGQLLPIHIQTCPQQCSNLHCKCKKNASAI